MGTGWLAAGAGHNSRHRPSIQGPPAGRKTGCSQLGALFSNLRATAFGGGVAPAPAGSDRSHLCRSYCAAREVGTRLTIVLYPSRLSVPLSPLHAPSLTLLAPSGPLDNHPTPAASSLVNTTASASASHRRAYQRTLPAMASAPIRRVPCPTIARAALPAMLDARSLAPPEGGRRSQHRAPARRYASGCLARPNVRNASPLRMLQGGVFLVPFSRQIKQQHCTVTIEWPSLRAPGLTEGSDQHPAWERLEDLIVFW
jgi:hypothetical protein